MAVFNILLEFDFLRFALIINYQLMIMATLVFDEPRRFGIDGSFCFSDF